MSTQQEQIDKQGTEVNHEASEETVATPSTKVSQDSDALENGAKKKAKGLMDKSSFDAISQFIIELLRKIGDFFKSPTGSYKDNPQMQQSALNSISEMGEVANNMKEKGDYTGAYLMERNKSYVEALHETAMKKDYSPNEIDQLAEDASELAAVKIAELDESELGQVAKNDYMSDLSESSLASLHGDISQKASSIYREHFGVETQDIVAKISGNDLNSLLETQNKEPLTPDQKTNGLDKEKSNYIDTPSQVRSLEVSQPSVEISSPSPGR